MARRCEFCGKKTRAGKKVSHSNRRTNRTFKPNIQKKLIFLEGRFQRLKICTQCLRTHAKSLTHPTPTKT